MAQGVNIPGYGIIRILFIAFFAILLFLLMFLYTPFGPDALLLINACLYPLAILLSLWLTRATLDLPGLEVRNESYRKAIANNMRFLRKNAAFWNILALIGFSFAVFVNFIARTAKEPQHDHSLFIWQEFALCLSCALIAYLILYALVNLRSVGKLKKDIRERISQEQTMLNIKESETSGKSALGKSADVEN